MEQVSAVEYETPNGGTLRVEYDRPEWLVTDNGTEIRFASVPQWIGYVRKTYGWPLKSHVID